jgi:hypothetical protein
MEKNFWALKQYPTQLHLFGKFLPSFTRPNEIFALLPLLELLPVEVEILPLQEHYIQELPISEPARESTRHLLLGGADLVGWRITRLGNALVLTAQTRGSLVPGLQYRILLKTPDGVTRFYKLTSPEASAFFNSFTINLDLSELGDPFVLSFAAEVSRGAVLDQTSWNMVILHEWLP